MTITTTKRYEKGKLVETLTTDCLQYKKNVIESLDAWRSWGYTVEAKFYTNGSYREVSFSHHLTDTRQVYSFT